jgi:glycosyltransferase involved in cell wall biosynthesis
VLGGGVIKVYSTVINDLRSDQRMNRVCGTLSEKFDVTLVGRELPDSKPLTEKPFQQVRLKCAFKQGPLFYLEYNLRLFKFLRNELGKNDLINAIDADTLLAALWVKKSTGCKVIFDAHEYFSEVPELSRSPIKKWVWQKIEDYGIPKTDGRYTVGPMLAELFSKRYKVGFETIRNCPKKYERLHEPEEPKHLLYQGALNEGRGLEHAIRALTLLPDLHLKIVGDGVLKPQLMELSGSLSVADRVHFEGFVSPDELPEFTSKAYLGLNVSEAKGQSYYYSLNNKCFDYIHAGLPAITNPFPEYQKIDQEYNVMEFADANDRSIADAVLKLLNCDSDYQKLRDNCLIASQNLNWEIEGQRLIKLYERVANAEHSII